MYDASELPKLEKSICWLVWCLDSKMQMALRAVCTHPSIARYYKKAIIIAGARAENPVVRVIIESTVTDHL